MSRFDYKAKDALGCWPEGEYDAVLEATEVTTSKSSGAPMQVISFRCYHPDGREQVVKDYVVNTTLFKLKRLAMALGKEADFRAEQFQACDQLRSRLTLVLGVEESAEYGDRNKIDGYKPGMTADASAPNFNAGKRTAAPGKAAPVTAPAESIEADDIPF